MYVHAWKIGWDGESTPDEGWTIETRACILGWTMEGSWIWKTLLGYCGPEYPEWSIY
jgi:hypothetical protein